MHEMPDMNNAVSGSVGVPQAPHQLLSGRRTGYQFPVYRWIGWLAVAGFAVGLTVMFFLSGMFGIPPPLGWAALVILFTLGALLLDRPRLLLIVMVFYFALMPMNRVLGLVGIPLPDFLDELFFLPPLAVIAMNWIQRRQVKQATMFPLAFCLLAGVSWFVNGKPSLFTAVQVSLIVLKPYILWYYCRLTCTFEDVRQLSRWIWAYIIYAAAQFFYNVLWQGGPWVRTHPDSSGGVFGPERVYGGAHLVGYISVFALFLLAGWWATRGRKANSRHRFWAVICALIIGYDLVFMTDTKHALILVPFAFLPFLFHPGFSARLRAGLLASGIVFVLASVFYFNMAVGQLGMYRQLRTLKNSPKGEILYAVTVDFPHLVPFPLFGAGPGRFTSPQAADARTPLARRYIIPYKDQQRRLAYFGRGGDVAQSSIVGIVDTDFFKLMGDFGWMGTALYYVFLFWIAVKLFGKSLEWPPGHLISGLFLGLNCCVIFLVFVTFLVGITTIPVVSFPLWIFIGRMWDIRKNGTPLESAFDGIHF